MTFVVSQGSISSVATPVPPRSLQIEQSEMLTLEYGQIWRKQPAVRMVVDFLGRNIAQLGLHQYQRLSDTDRVRVDDDPLARLLNNPGYGVTPYRLKDALVHDLGTYDNAYWLKMKVDGHLKLLRLMPRTVTPLGGSWFAPDKWRVRGNKGYKDYDVDQVVHFHGFNADDPRIGSSPIEALRRTLIEDFEAGRMREQVLRNGARMSGYITRPANAPDWIKNKGFDRFKESWQAQYTGSGPQSGGTPILEDGMEFQNASINPTELQYIEARKLSREEVAAAYFIPPPMVGILEHATFSNIEQQHRMLYQDTLGPWLEMIQQEIELQLLPELAKRQRTYVEFNLAAKLQGSFVEQTNALTKAVGAPWMTRNEARGKQNLPAVEGGDDLITPLNVTKGGQASPLDPTAVPESD